MVAAWAGALAAGPGAATPALAAPVPTVQVPCSTGTLSRAISGAASGAVRNLTVTNVNFKNGYSSYQGGAIFARHGPLSVTGGTFTGNYSLGYGGGVYNEDAVYNHAPAGEGGGIYNSDTVNLTNTVVRFNTADNCAPALSVNGCTG